MVTLAIVTGAHGIAGEVRLKLFTDDLSPYRRFDAGDRPLELERVRPAGAGAVARFAGITDRDAAEALRGAELRVRRDALPALAEDEYYHADLIGLACADEQGAALGRVVSVDNFGAGDVIEIERPDGGRFMVPFTRTAVPEWSDDRLVVDSAFIG